MSLNDLKNLDVTVSMKSTSDAIKSAIEMLSPDLKTGGASCSPNDQEILSAINQKLLEVEEEFYRPLDAPEVFEQLKGIASTAGNASLEGYCQGQMNLLKANDLHFQGYTALFYGDCVEATRFLKQAVDFAPDHPVAGVDLEKAEKRLAKAPEELAKAEAAIEKAPDKSANWLKKANALVTMGKMEEALPFFDKAIELDPTSPDAMAKKGATLEGMGKFVEAVTLFHKVLTIKPNSQIAKKGLNLSEYFTGER